MDQSIPVSVGAVRLRLTPPSGWDHVNNGGRHEFRSGDQHMVLMDEGIAVPETLATVITAGRERLGQEDGRNELTALSWRDDPVLAARSLEERQGFWRNWVSVSTDPFRQPTDMSRAVDTLIVRSHALRMASPQQLARWVVAHRVDTLRYQIDRVVPTESHGATWWVARTWLRSSHMYEQRYASAVVEGRLVVLESGPLLEPQTSATFEALILSMAPEGMASH